MILKVLRKLITAPLHIIQHSYRRAQQGFAYLAKQPGYLRYGPDAQVKDDRAYVSPVFELEPTRTSAPDPGPGLHPEPRVKLGFEEKKALKDFTTQYEYVTQNEEAVEYDDFAAEVFNNIVENIQENIEKNNNVKALLRVKIKLDDGSTTWISTTHFDDDLNKYTSEESIRAMVKKGFEGELQKKIEFFCDRYAHAMVGVEAMTVGVNRNPSRRGGTYVASPAAIKTKHGFINVNNTDDFCFKYAICTALFRERVSPKMRRPCLSKPQTWRKFFPELDWTGMSFPTSLKNVDTFEENNPDINVNVWTMEEDNQHCELVRLSKHEVVHGRTRIVHLLMLAAPGDDCGFLNHFTTILNIGTFRRTGKTCKKYPCLTCTHMFNSTKLLKQHMEQGCHVAQDGPIEVMPTKNVPIQFEDKNNKKCRHHPYVIYADFESCLVPIDKEDPRFRSFPKSATTVHEILSYCFYQLIWTVKNGDEVFKKVHKVRTSEQSEHQFMQQYMADIKQCSHETYKYFCQNDLAVLTPEEISDFWKIKKCCICKKCFTHNSRHHHHEHPTGKYVGPAHPNCNLTCNDWHFENSVFFHNLKGYDSHHILLGSGKDVSGAPDLRHNLMKHLTQENIFDGEISAIAESAEKHKVIDWKPDYSSLKVDGHQNPHIRIKFKDSMAFLEGSLAKSVESLKATEKARNSQPTRNKMPKRFTHYFPTLRNYVKDLPMKNREMSTIKHGMDLLKQKGVFCYDYVNSIDALELDHLPSIDDFYNRLTDSPCSLEDYEHAQKVWKFFRCKTLRDYHDIYLNTDVALLADVFQNFRQLCFKFYKIDPVVFISAPQMFWDAMLKFTGVKLDVMLDHEMYLFWEKHMRGGTTFLNEQYATANNKHIPGFSEDKPSNYLVYLDANNLYGYAMSKILPTGNFKWVHDDNLSDLPNIHVGTSSKTGYTLEVDLHLPEKYHDNLKDFPPLCERTTIPLKDLSPFDFKCNQSISKKGNTQKLINHLAPVKKYVLNIYTLQHLKKLGYKVTKVHRAVSFHQSFWLRDYIAYNTSKRQAAKEDGDDLMAAFFKLGNNAVFGKCLENVRNYSDFKFAYNQTTAYNLFTDSAFNTSSIINENLVGVQLHKKVVHLNKPIYVGMTILDYSKTYMTDFYHNKLKKFYGDRLRLLYTDTDSVVLNVATHDVFEDLQHPDLNSEFDFHKSKRNHNDVPYMTVGKMKLEYGPDQHLEEWVGVTNKVYAIKVAEKPDVYKTTSKGFRMNNSEEALQIYKDAVFTKTHKTVPVRSILSKHQRLFTLEQTKIGANPSFGDKRYALEPDHVNRRYNSVPFGYNPS